MVHPDLLRTFNSTKQRIRREQLELREAVLAALPFLHLPTQEVCHELLPVANSQNRGVRAQQARIERRAAGIVDARRTAGNDDASASSQLGGRSFAGSDIGVYAQVAHFSRDQVAIL